MLANAEFYPLEAPTKEQFLSIQDWLNEKPDTQTPFQYGFDDICDFGFLGQ